MSQIIKAPDPWIQKPKVYQWCYKYHKCSSCFENDSLLLLHPLFQKKKSLQLRGVRLLPLLLRLSTFKASLLYSPGSCAVSTVSRLIECFLALGSHELAYWSRKLNHLLDHGLISSSRWPNHIFNQVIKTKFTTWNLVRDLAVQFAGLVTDLSSLASLAPDTTNAWLEKKLEVKNYSHLTPEICYSGEALRDCPGAIVYSGNLLVFCY